MVLRSRGYTRGGIFAPKVVHTVPKVTVLGVKTGFLRPLYVNFAEIPISGNSGSSSAGGEAPAA